MTKHIGIIAVSHEGAALCYRTICREAMVQVGDTFHPEITVHNHPLNSYMKYIQKGDWDGVASLMISSVAKLAASGAEFAICPDNTVHRAFEKVKAYSPLPLISIVETVVEECRLRDYKKVGVLGTKYTMQGPLYKNAFSKFEINTVVPNEKDQEIINLIIMNELCIGEIKKSSTKIMIRIINKLKNLGCDAIILGCTEIPLMINSDNSPLPLVDSTHLIAEKALGQALKKS